MSRIPLCIMFKAFIVFAADGTASFDGLSMQHHADHQNVLHSSTADDVTVGVDPNKRQGKIIKNRKMITSARRTLIVAAKVMLLFAGASIYFAVSFSLEHKEFNRQYVSMAEQAYAARRNTLLGDSGVSIRDFQFAAFRPSIFRPLAFASAGGRLLNAACAVSGL